jgi:hypothetical protein
VRPGLLYAGTEFGFFVSFDNGTRWQPLQQNLPATPVTDLRVHRDDLVISTMGRSFWIMDNVTPLRQVSAKQMTAAAVLLQPKDAVRYRSAAGGRGAASGPQYTAVAAAIDYIVPAGSPGPLSLEIRNAAGQLVRTITSGSGQTGRGRERSETSGDPDDPDMRDAGGRGRGGAANLTARGGHNRFMWDYRWANNGPTVAPGRYTVQLKAGDQTAGGPKTFEVKMDPRLVKDGIAVADLVEQEKFLLQVRAAVIEANDLRQRLQQAMTTAGVRPSPSPGPGERSSSLKHTHPLQALWARLVTAPGTYEQGMVIDQLSQIVRAEGGADQKVGQEARKRFDDLLKELKSIQAEFGKL